MAEDKKPLTYEELTMSNMFQLESMYRILIEKGLITEQEFISKWKEIKKEYDKENKK